MMDKLIEHLSKEIQTVTETTMSFRTRIAFIAWIGPFVILSSIVVGTKGVFRVDLYDIIFWCALVVFCLSYVGLAILGGRIEKGASERCDALRQKLIEYAKLPSADSIRVKDIDYTVMTNNVGRAYGWSFGVILLGFLSAAVAVSRLEVKSPGDKVCARSSRAMTRAADNFATTNMSTGKLDLSSPDNKTTNDANNTSQGMPHPAQQP